MIFWYTTTLPSAPCAASRDASAPRARWSSGTSVCHHHSAQVSRSALHLAINFHQAVPACSFWLLAEWEIFTWMARLICGNVDLFSSSPESTLWAKFYIFSTFTCRCQHDLPPWQGVHLMWFCLPPVMWQLHQSGALHQSVCARMLLSTGHGRLPGEVCATITVSLHNKYVGWVMYAYICVWSVCICLCVLLKGCCTKIQAGWED